MFSKIEPRSPVAALVHLSPGEVRRGNYWACNAHPCPNCGRETLYWVRLRDGFDPETTPVVAAQLAMYAKGQVYTCPECEATWQNVAGYRELYPRQPRLRVVPSPPATR